MKSPQSIESVPCFEGQESLRPFAVTGQMMRMGLPDQLSVSDKARIAALINQQNKSDAIEYLHTIFSNHNFIILGFIEWCLRYSTVVADRKTASLEREITKKVFDLWKKELNLLSSGDEESKWVSSLLSHFNLETVTPNSVADLLSAFSQGEKTLVSEICHNIDLNKESLLKDIENNNTADALKSLDQHFKEVCTYHDAFAHYTSAYANVIYREFGQKEAEEVMHLSFSSCSFYENLFTLASALTPEQLAAFFSDHLRTHFSGHNREGGVEIVDEDDCYRLIFKPCGTGGVVRQRLGENLVKFSDKSSATWNRSNEVPAYCTHCASNELEFIKRLGYPAAVTEFNPDQNQSCGWVIYKDPHKIPDHFFERLGLKKDSEKFKSRDSS